MLKTALKYKSLGLSVIGCREKRPVSASWAAYQKEIPSDEDLSDMFEKRGADQVAVICGEVSGSLEVIDIDEPDLWGELWETIVDYFSGDPSHLLVTRTPSSGFHIYYRCEKIEGNQKLAREKTGSNKYKVLIETRGQGGYVIAPPSNKYEILSGSFERIPEIDPDTRDDLLDICRSFNKVFTEKASKPGNISPTVYKSAPWDAYNQDASDPWEAILIGKGWERVQEDAERIYYRRPGSENKFSANFHKTKRLFYVFSSSTTFEHDSAYSPFAIYAFLECGGNFSEATKQIRAQGYGKLFSKDDKDTIKAVAANFAAGLTISDIEKMNAADLAKYSEEEKEVIIEAAEASVKATTGAFWYVTNRGSVKLLKYGLADLLSSLGFSLFSQDKYSLVYRRIRIDKENHIVKEVSIDMIKATVKEWLYMTDFSEYDARREEVLEALMSLNNSVWDNILEWLPKKTMDEINFLRDTKTVSYHAFKDKIIIIKTSGMTEINYQDLDPDQFIWENKILDKTCNLIYMDSESDLNASYFYRFIKRLSDIGPDLENVNYKDLPEEKKMRLNAFMTAIGYLSYNYKDPSAPYAIIIAEDTADEGKGGGTGKGLLMQAIQNVRPVCTLFGKEWKPDKNFAYQQVKLGTDVLCIEDVTKFFKFEQIYNIITEGLTIERKNKDALSLPYNLSPKVAITTNYDIATDGEHAQRRAKKILLAKYFHKDLTPYDEFGTMFFSDEWDALQWDYFYNTIFHFIRLYMTHGFSEFIETDNMREKAIRVRYGEEFFTWFDGFMNEYSGEEAILKDLYSKFLEEFDLDRKSYSSQRFRYAVKIYCEKFGYAIESERDHSRERRGVTIVHFKKII